MTDAVSRWRDYWLTLPDNAFFEAMRLFPVNLPQTAAFNKHKMIDALIGFFLKKENRKTIIDALDAGDRKLLSAAALFPDLAPSKLYFFFRNDETEEHFFFRLLNLEERMLIYRRNENSKIALNPILEPDLRHDIISADYFFRAVQTSTPPEPVLPSVSDSLVLAVAAFLNADTKALRGNGELRKKQNETLLKLLRARGDTEPEAEYCLRLVLAFFHGNGVFREEDNYPVFDPERFLNLRTLTVSDLLFRVMASDSRLPQTAPVAETASLLRALTRETARLKNCNTEEFETLFYLLSGCSGQTKTDAALFRKVLTDCRFLLEDDHLVYPNPILNPDDNDSGNRRTVVQNDGQILFSPGSNPQESFFLPLFADIADFNFFPVFRITRESLFRAFDAGLTPQTVSAHLNALSAHPLPSVLEKKIITAFESYREVRIWTGITVVLPPAKAAAAEKLPALKTFMSGHPTETVFIFPEESFNEAAEALSSLGITHIPAVPRRKPQPDAEPFCQPSVPATDPALPFEITECPPLSVGQLPASETEALRHILRNKPYSDALKEELEAKIEKKIILFPEQIDLHAEHPGLSSASGLDFAHKLNLIRSALKDSAFFLEISVFTGGKKKTVPAVPIELKRIENRQFLFYKSPGKEETFSLDTGKIASVRLVRSSLRLY